MKTFYIFLFFTLVSATCFADTYYTYTATKSGNWNDMSVWSIAVRNDGINKTKVIIAASYTILVDNAVNGFGLGDVDINIFGSLSLQPSTTIALSAASSIELFGSGKVIGTTATQKINIGTITKYNGSLDFTKTGPSIANVTTGISPAGFKSSSLLPVLFTSFTAVKNGNDITLKWTTASETDNNYFDLERSYDGNNWTAISTIKASGSATASAGYSFTDSRFSGALVYYRLKQVDINGTGHYSTVKTIRNGNLSAANIYAAGKTVTVDLNTALTHTIIVTVMNTNGQLLQQQQFNAGYKIVMNVNSNVNGIAIVNVTDNSTLNQTAKLLL